jgi:hypothetical protein
LSQLQWLSVVGGGADGDRGYFDLERRWNPRPRLETPKFLALWNLGVSFSPPIRPGTLL